MPEISRPASLVPNGIVLRPRVVSRGFGSPFGGSEQFVDLLQDRWTAELDFPPRTRAKGQEARAFFAALRGATGTTRLYDFAQPVPRGTLRGAPSILAAATKGAASVTIFGASRETLLAGDKIGVNGLLLEVAEDCTLNASGVGVVQLTTRLRTPAIGFSRASTGTYIDYLWTLQTAGVHEARIDRSRVNLLAASEDIAGAQWPGLVRAATGKSYNGSTFFEIAKQTTTTSEYCYAWARSTAGTGSTVFPAGTVMTVTLVLLAGTTNSITFGLLGSYDGWGSTSSPNLTASIISGPGAVVNSSGRVEATGLSATTPTVVRLTRDVETAQTVRLNLYPGTYASTTVGDSVLVTQPMANLGASVLPYEPTGPGIGKLLVEPARTNSIAQSQNLALTPWTGCNRTLAAEFWAGNVPFYECAKLLTTQEAFTSGAVAVAAGETWTLTLALLAGTKTTCSVGLYGTVTGPNGFWGEVADCTKEIISGPGTFATYSAAVGGLWHIDNLHTSIPTLVRVTRTFTAAMSARLYGYPGRTSSVTVGDSIKATRVQLEKGADATSDIPTTTAAVTREADLITVAA
jgi:hypothetical protein